MESKNVASQNILVKNRRIRAGILIIIAMASLVIGIVISKQALSENGQGLLRNRYLYLGYAFFALSASSGTTAFYTSWLKPFLDNKKKKAKKFEEVFSPRVWSLSEIDILKIEYEQLHSEIMQRNQYAWLIISIFAAGSFVIGFGVEPSTELMPAKYMIAIFLVFFCGLAQKYYGESNRSCWERRLEIENMLGIEGPKIRYEKLKENNWYQMRDSTLWFMTWLFLIFVYSIFLYLAL